jgi:DNA-binding transcriptional ArsR family regulator
MKKEIKRKFDDVEEAIEFMRLLQSGGEVEKIGVVGSVDVDELLEKAAQPIVEAPEDLEEAIPLEDEESAEDGRQGAEKEGHPGAASQDGRCGYGERQEQALRALREVGMDQWITSKHLSQRTDPKGPDNWTHATARAALSKLYDKGAVDRRMEDQTAYYRGLGEATERDYRPIPEGTQQHEVLSVAHILEERGCEVTSLSVAEHTAQPKERVSTNFSKLSQRGFFERVGEVERKTGSNVIVWELTEQGQEEMTRIGIYAPEMDW